MTDVLVRVRVSWLGDPIHDVILSPPRDYALGEGDADFVMPREVLGRERLPIVRASGGRTEVGVALGEHPPVVDASRTPHDPSLGFFEMKLGQRFAQSFGDFVVDVSLEPAVRSPVRRFFMRFSTAGYFGGSLSLGAGVLGSAMYFSPPLMLSEETSADQLYLIRHYLAASAAREREVRRGSGDRGGVGELRLGSAEGRGKRARSRAPGPASGVEPKLTRRDAMSQAVQFGMIGLEHISLGADSGSARGELWGTPDGSDEESGNAGVRDEGDSFADFGINPAVDPKQDRLSTFAVDVDTGSFFVVKRYLEEGALPPLTAVRPEELLNAFDYGYAGPEADEPFRVHLDAVPSPFDRGRHFLRVAIQGKRVAPSARPPLHLTYLVDTSGSMQGEDRIGLAQQSLRLLTRRLRPGDTVALCTYAGFVREVLPPTRIEDTARIWRAIDELGAGGSTAMASGIQLAYELASRTQRPGHESRVVVLSDGDANVGPMSADEILELVFEQRAKGITLSTVGFGRGNYRDATMERLADAGDGNYSYVGSRRDAERVFGRAADGLMHVIARDVKVQVELNPEAIDEYRLIGYENRDVADGDFRKDEIDGGEIGAGHSVTALYEIALRPGSAWPVKVSLRHKPAAEGPSARALMSEVTMERRAVWASFDAAPASLRFAVAVAAFGESLRGSPRALGWSLERIAEQSRAAEEGDAERAELTALVRTAASRRAR